MIRASRFFVGLLLTNVQMTTAKPAYVKNSKCALDGAVAVANVADAAVYLWAAVKRCGDKPPMGDQIKCALDVTSALQSVNDMVTTIVAAANDCGAVHTENYDCGMAVGSLTSASAGLGAAISAIVDDCTNRKAPSARVPQDRMTNSGKCFIDAKDTATNLFKASNAIAKVTPTCKAGESGCTHNTLNLMVFLSSMGGALASSVNDCEAFAGTGGDANAACSGDVLNAVAALNSIADAGVSIHEKCQVSAKRLYEVEHAAKDDDTTTIVLNFSNGMFLPMAFVPIALLIGYVGGRRMGKTRPARAASATTLGDETDDQHETSRIAAL